MEEIGLHFAISHRLFPYVVALFSSQVLISHAFAAHKHRLDVYFEM